MTQHLKRCFDLAVAAAVLLAAAPLLCLLMLLVRMDSPGGALFRQVRVGRGGRLFTLLKLRTFHEHAHGYYGEEEIRWQDPRITRMGRWLRRSKLDELPQLINVLRGEMSIVGPRPDLPEQVEKYGPAERVRLQVAPGLTGIAQISGNTWLGWPERIQMDRWYVSNRCLQLDLAILWHTAPIMLRGERSMDDPLGLRRKLAIHL